MTRILDCADRLFRHYGYGKTNVADIARSKRFYGEVFGWQFTDYGVAYTEFDDGRLKGGFVADAQVRAHGGPLVILYCADLADAERRVVAAGGEVVQAV
ncbi:VOC family protein, partial [Mesorhizobium sp. M8A.F.Ca.ET.182.01.1.1]|uniref:VOC family protein n=1 Tax=Mesorhizobium sp. M8A.F.Ca.ET.182.01.1.1 TaxID=2563964 RepID=UPI001FEF7B47